MPIGLSFTASGVNIDPTRANIQAGCAAARSVIRRAGFTLAQAEAAARACLRGAEPGAFNRAAAATWFRAQAIGVSVAWPAGRAPAGAAMVIASWEPGPSRRRAAARWDAERSRIGADA